MDVIIQRSGTVSPFLHDCQSTNNRSEGYNNRLSLLRTKLWATLSSELRIELFLSHCFCSTSQTPTLSPLTIRESVRPVLDDNILSSLRETSVLGAVSVMQSTRLSAPHSSVPDCLYLPDGSEVSVRMFCLLTGKTSQDIIIE